MAKRDKRLAAIRSNPRQVRFADLKTALEARGFAARPGRGDHWVFIHPLLPYPIVVDPRRPFVLPVYVRSALRAIEEVEDKLQGGD